MIKRSYRLFQSIFSSWALWHFQAPERRHPGKPGHPAPWPISMRITEPMEIIMHPNLIPTWTGARKWTMDPARTCRRSWPRALKRSPPCCLPVWHCLLTATGMLCTSLQLYWLGIWISVSRIFVNVSTDSSQQLARMGKKPGDWCWNESSTLSLCGLQAPLLIERKETLALERTKEHLPQHSYHSFTGHWVSLEQGPSSSLVSHHPPPPEILGCNYFSLVTFNKNLLYK